MPGFTCHLNCSSESLDAPRLCACLPQAGLARAFRRRYCSPIPRRGPLYKFYIPKSLAAHFLRTGTPPLPATFPAQETQNAQLISLANQMHYQATKVMNMSSQQYGPSGICERYQTLLEECGIALGIWDKYRARIAETGSAGKEEGDEIFRLQAKYARAHAALQKHLHECLLCRLITKFEGSQASDATTLYDLSRH